MKQSGKRYAKMREIRDIAIRKINKINWRQLRLELILDARQDSTCDFFRSTPQRVKFHCVQLTDAWKESRSDDFEIFDKKLKLLFNFPERLLIMSKILNYTGAALSNKRRLEIFVGKMPFQRHKIQNFPGGAYSRTPLETCRHYLIT